MIWEMKVLPLHCKRLDLRVARMTTSDGGPVFVFVFVFFTFVSF